MGGLVIVQDLMTSLEAGDLNKVSDLLSDDFMFTLPIPFPIGKFQVMAFLGVFKKAFSDWKYNFSGAIEEGNNVKGTVKPGGTHTNDIQLPGMPTLLATGKLITLPEIPVEIITKDNKVSGIKIEMIPGGSLANLMQDLGVNIPGM